MTNTTAHRRHVPALDGIRGCAMTLFMAFHFGLAQLRGAWVSVNVFFVLSGFLIVRLLATEHAKYGIIDWLAFYRRRARRLLPALFIMLSTVVVYGLVVADATERGRLRDDVFASLGFFMNWRLVRQDNDYFEAFGQPSLLKHAWTLAVEEQFYVLAPFVITVLFIWLRSRRARVAVLCGAALASAVWAAYIGTSTAQAQAHVYYGTDARAHSLLIGAACGLAFAPTRRGRYPWKVGQRTLAVIGWLGLAGYIASAFLVPPFAGWMFEGPGMLLSSVLAGGLVVACAFDQASPMQRILGWKPIAYLGRISYGLYLWHWPVHLWLHRVGPTWPTPVHVLAAAASTILLATISYELVERRVIRDGLRGLVPSRGLGRLVAAGSAAGLVLGASAIGAGAAGPTAPSWVLGYPRLVSDQPDYRAPASPVKVAVFGDSVPTLLARNFPSGNFPGFTPLNLAVPGCDLLNEPIVFPPPLPPATLSAECEGAKKNFRSRVERSAASEIILFASPLMAFRHVVDGKQLWWDDPRYQQAVSATFDRYLSATRSTGKRMQIVTVPCRPASAVTSDVLAAVRSDPKLEREARTAEHINALVRSWGAARGVPVLDLDRAVCGKGPRNQVDGIELFGDGIHFSEAATPAIWGWLAPQIIANSKRSGP